MPQYYTVPSGKVANLKLHTWTALVEDDILERMKSRFRKSSEGQAQNMDGVLGAPVPRAEGPGHHFGDGIANAQASSARQVGNFGQAEGYHPADAHSPKRSMSQAVLSDQPQVAPLQNTPAPTQREEKRHFSWRKLRKWLKRLSLVLAVVAVSFGVFALVKVFMNLHQAFRGNGKSAVGLQSHISTADLKAEGDSRINILLLGIGGAGHDGPDLTDTMLVASIDPVNHTMALVSVPRDLWVNIPHHGSMKINAAYETGKYAYLGKQSASNSDTKAVEAGFASSDSIVSQVLGISIQYNVLLDFQAFQQAVNTVGGVTVNVPTELYDPTMAWENGGSPVLARPGVQTFDGLRALFYVRSRETTSDFARTQRQRAVIVALAQKVFSLGTLSNPVKMTQLLDAFGSNVVTDISLSDMTKLYGVAKNINLSGVQSIGLADPPNNYVTTGHIGTQSVVEPRAGLNNYGAIQNYVHSVLVDGYIIKEHADVLVLNGTSSATTLTKAVATLKSYGYNIVATGNAPTVDYPQTVIVDHSGGKSAYTLNYLQHRYHVTATKDLPGGIAPGTAQFVIILGQDQS